MRFASPLAFLLLLFLPVIAWRLFGNSKSPAFRFSSVALPKASGRSLRQRFIFLPPAIRILALILLIIALARPQEGVEKFLDVTKGIAIEMVLDRSGSMQAEMETGSGRAMRLDAAKKIFAEFVNGNGADLSGRQNDLVGMITFARFAETVCPLTLAHGVLDHFLDGVQLVDRRDEDGTAIGDAIALAAARLKTAGENLAQQKEQGGRQYEITSKVIILLTDGENNMGEQTPEQAATLAKEWGIKIYAIGVGGEETLAVPTIFGTRAVKARSGVDRQALEKIAEITGGRFWLAEDGEALRTVYETINSLEKSEFESVRYVNYRERFMPFALAAAVLLLLEILLRQTVFRRIP